MRLVFFSTLIVVYLILSLIRSCSTYSGRASIEFIDVGQGDSIRIITPHNNTILIDGGPNYESDSVLPSGTFFDKCVIEIMVLTHPHADHSVGLDRINKRCEVKRYVTAEELWAGKSFKIDGIEFKIIWPPYQYKSSDKNDESIVILMEYGGFVALFTGDVSGEILCTLNLPKVDVYKVSHHGSITGLCDKLIFDTAVISVGENTFGHPSQKVLSSLKSSGTKIYRTDVDGSIMILLDHGNFPVYKRKPHKGS